MKKCSKCREEKALEEFRQRGDRRGKYRYAHCRACERAEQMARYHDDIDLASRLASLGAAGLFVAVLIYQSMMESEAAR